MTAQSVRARRLRRLGWATPALAVGVTAVGLGVTVGPTLGTKVPIPSHILLLAPATTAPVQPRAPSHRPAAKPSATPRATPAPSTRVVPPVRPVVTATTDDTHDDNGGQSDSGTDR